MTPRSLPPPSQRILSPIYLPLAPFQSHTRTCLRDLTVLHNEPSDLFNQRVDVLMDAILHKWLVDWEGERLASFVDTIPEYPVVIDAMITELLGAFHRLLCSTVGTLVPSLRYRYEIQPWIDTLKITPTYPTLEDYDQRIQAIANPESGWVPARWRQRG
jgi:hypothetical protein